MITLYNKYPKTKRNNARAVLLSTGKKNKIAKNHLLFQVSIILTIVSQDDIKLTISIKK